MLRKLQASMKTVSLFNNNYKVLPLCSHIRHFKMEASKCTRTFNNSNNFKALISEKLMMDKIVTVTGNYIEQMVRVTSRCDGNDQIWCAVEDGIHVYDQFCNKVKEIKHAAISHTFGLTVVENEIILGSHEVIVVACHSGKGLHQISDNGEYLSMISKGSFSDVAFFNDLLFTLDCENSLVVIYELGKSTPVDRDNVETTGNMYDNYKIDLKCNDNTDLIKRNTSLETKKMKFKVPIWKNKALFNLDYQNGHMDDKIFVNELGIFIMSWQNRRLYVYSHNDFALQYSTGKYGIGGEAGNLDYPLLCGVDSKGNCLVADHNNNRLQVHDHLERKWEVACHNIMSTTENQSDISNVMSSGHICKPVHALWLENCGYLFVSTGATDIGKLLIRFKKV